jgi:hypothetical protein
MKNKLVYLFLMLLITTRGLAQAAVEKETDPSAPETVVSSPKPLAIENFSPDHLKGTWALGYDYFYGAGSTISVRNWIESDLALDLLVGGNFSPGYPITDFNINNYYSWNYSVGVGLRQNIARPLKDVFIQLLVLLSYSQGFSQTTDGSVTPSDIYGSQSQTLNLFIGPGFEAFMPFLEDFSVEANLGLNITSYWVEGSGAYESYGWSWRASLGSDSSTFSLFNAAAHFYF